ncbi:hypothetical protein D3C78_1604800 [compost metagenome]
MNSVRLTLRITRKSLGCISPIEYTITTAASVACGIKPRRGASRIIVNNVMPAVTREAIGERAPAIRFTAVCDVPPPEGIAPKKELPTFAKPVANSSLFV